MIETVPNVSEGRRPPVIRRLADAVETVTGVSLLDVHSDPSHNRSVFTCAGTAAGVRGAAIALAAAAISDIDLRLHRGAHPRIGAIDVVPFVPLGDATMEECVALARETGAELARRFDLPVYLYEAASTAPHRKRLEDIRRGQFEGLREKMARPEWHPDFGPAHPHPSAGAVVVGARMPLIAFNVNLASSRVDLAREIAATVRERGGGLPSVKALGLMLAERGVVQVSMNLTNYHVTSMRAAFDAVDREARRLGVDLLESELVGLVPRDAIGPGDAEYVNLKGFSPDQVLEARLAKRVAVQPGS